MFTGSFDLHRAKHVAGVVVYFCVFCLLGNATLRCFAEHRTAAAYALTCVFGILLCLNAGSSSSVSMVNVSVKFHKCIVGLKKRQVNLIDDEMLKFDNLDLRANVCYRFGFRDPIFNAHLDERQVHEAVPYAIGVATVVVIIIAAFWYRSQRIRIFRWRIGIESTLCVGIIRPGENIEASWLRLPR